MGWTVDRESTLLTGESATSPFKSGIYQFTLGSPNSCRRKRDPRAYVVPNVSPLFVGDNLFILKTCKIQRITRNNFRFELVEFEMKYLVLQGLARRTAVCVHMPVMDLRCATCSEHSCESCSELFRNRPSCSTCGSRRRVCKDCAVCPKCRDCARCQDRLRSPILARKNDLADLAASITRFRDRTVHLNYPDLLLESGATPRHLGHKASELAFLWHLISSKLRTNIGFAINMVHHRDHASDFADMLPPESLRVVYVPEEGRHVWLRDIFPDTPFVVDCGGPVQLDSMSAVHATRNAYASVTPAPPAPGIIFRVHDYIEHPLLLFSVHTPKKPFLVKLRNEVENGRYSGVQLDHLLLIKSHVPRAEEQDGVITVESPLPALVARTLKRIMGKSETFVLDDRPGPRYYMLPHPNLKDIIVVAVVKKVAVFS